MINCKDCAWFAPIESNPKAEEMHKVMQDAFGGILPPREDKVGICRKVTFSEDRPVMTHECGYCHRTGEMVAE